MQLFLKEFFEISALRTGVDGKRGDLIEDAPELLLQIVKVLEPIGEENVVDLFVVAADVVRGGLLLRIGGAGVVRIVVLLDGIRERVTLGQSNYIF